VNRRSFIGSLLAGLGAILAGCRPGKAAMQQTVDPKPKGYMALVDDPWPYDVAMLKITNVRGLTKTGTNAVCIAYDATDNDNVVKAFEFLYDTPGVGPLPVGWWVVATKLADLWVINHQPLRGTRVVESVFIQRQHKEDLWDIVAPDNHVNNHFA